MHGSTNGGGRLSPDQQPTGGAVATDLIVATANPQALDATVQQLGPAVVVDGSWTGQTCRVRVFGDPGYIRFAITNQGYGQIEGEAPVTPESADAAH